VIKREKRMSYIEGIYREEENEFEEER